MKIVVIGSGGREHALVWKVSQSKLTQEIFALPGNGGTTEIATNVSVNASNVDALHHTVVNLKPDLVIVGPEQPLSLGIVDRLRADKIPCFGPTKAASQLEASKVFAKELMRDHHVPTATFEVFDDFDKVVAFVESNPNPDQWVVKADGLAAGKGAFVCNSAAEVMEVALSLLVKKSLGKAGEKIILERKLSGREVSAHYICDSEAFIPLPSAQDYKRAYDGQIGPNTGGMGSVCPVDHYTKEIQQDVETKIIKPILKAMAERGTSYSGVLYAGLMLTESGPQVIEFNCRFGDPETQAIMPVWEVDLVEIALACAMNKLVSIKPSVHTQKHAICVALVADGYPNEYEKGIELHEPETVQNGYIFHAGTERKNSRLLSSGGRVLNAVGIGNDYVSAKKNAYQIAENLKVPGLRYRTDIADDFII